MSERIDKIKAHLKENKVTYFVGAGCLVVGSAVSFFAFGNGVQNVDSFKFINWKSSHTSQTIQFPTRGQVGHVIVNDRTGDFYGSIREAAEKLGVTRYDLWAHLKGYVDSIDGETFTDLGENLSGEVKISV